MLPPLTALVASLFPTLAEFAGTGQSRRLGSQPFHPLAAGLLIWSLGVAAAFAADEE